MEAENVPEKVDDPEQSVSGTHPGKSPVVASPLDSSHAGQRPGDALEIRD